MPPPRSQARFIARTLPGAMTAPYPGFVAPMLPTLRTAVPRGAKWLHEIAFDGARVQAHLAEGRASLFTAGGEDCTRRYSAIAAAVKALPANHAIIDGVIAGPPDERSEATACYAFDLLFLDGFDIRAAPLAERKRVLQGFLAEAKQQQVARMSAAKSGISLPASPRMSLRSCELQSLEETGNPHITYSEHLADGAAMLRHAREIGARGIVSKSKEARYRSGRTTEWLLIT
jgi:bifunctional non-homologous end joining protein LigD